MKLSKLTKFLDRLDDSDMHYTLTSECENAIMVGVTVSGERWEIEFDADGEIEVEIFRSDGEIHDFSIIEDLFERHDDE